MLPPVIIMSFNNLKMLAIVTGVIATALAAGNTLLQDIRAISANGWDANGVNADGDNNRVSSETTDGSSEVKGSNGGDGIGTPGKDGVGSPGNDGIGTTGTDGVGSS